MPNTAQTVFGDVIAVGRKAWWSGFQVATGGAAGTALVGPQRVQDIGVLRGDGTNLVAANASDIRNVCGYDIAIGDIVQIDPFQAVPSTPGLGGQPAAAQLGFGAAAGALADAQVATNGLGPVVGAPGIVNNSNGAFSLANATPANILLASRFGVVTHVHPDVNRLVNPSSVTPKLAAQRQGGWVDVAFVGIVLSRVRRRGTNTDGAGEIVGIYAPAVANIITNAGGVLGTNADKPCFTTGDSAAAALISTLTAAAMTPAATARCMAQWGVLMEPMGTSGGSNEQVQRLVQLPIANAI